MRAEAILAVLVVLSGLAAAASNIEADSFYKSAEIYYQSGDYKNALNTVYRAREVYEQVDNSWGVEKCDSMINNIESLLSGNQLASTYKSIANDYFLQGGYDNLQKSVEFAERAKLIYQNLGDNTNVLITEDLITRARAQMNKEMVECIRVGDEFYQLAQDAFLSDFYVSAKNYALNASEKYHSCPYEAGVSNSASLLTSINNKMSSIRMQAKAAYDDAIKFHASGDNQRCVEYAADAQNLYTSIDDKEGMSTATLLASRCREVIDDTKEQRMREAQSLYEEAKRFAIMENECLNATDRANKAKSIYMDFYNEAYNMEWRLPPDKQINMKRYWAYVSEVNALLSDIQDTCGRERMLQIAEEYYKNSQEMYLENQMINAKAYANKAREICDQLKNYVCLSKVDSFINQINLRTKQRDDAHMYLQNAIAYYNVADFDSAMMDASKSKKIYMDIRDEESTANVEELMAKITEGAEKLDEANGYYSKAQGYYDTSDYRNALPWAESANNIYVEINYSLGITRTDGIIKESREKVRQQDIEFRNAVIVGAVILIVTGVLIFQILSRRRVMETEFRKKKMEEAERVRRRDEEWAIRRDSETKTKVEDELRKLIEEERTRVD
ncbi:MAG: hypothetical protein GF416_08860 [Candidatus Altiarchaeales archaeon]|nr:hypothetical protein [Candidatus Altiarchaeales archaeon]MBD3417227.1 hypothetical protein [Candidatus Altiarchaeales archaeon]